ncbi:uncharacterized protein LOC110109821, partial [Dendrobium catenatum]|uniref:uncharacterized protein LOC110109821 n=1 Tax=Dendrobium catenatum TaxID=906689 RepID=UPI0009F55FE5
GLRNPLPPLAFPPPPGRGCLPPWPRTLSPPLPSTSASTASPASTVLPLWKNLLNSTPQVSPDFSHSLTFIPAQNFTAEFTTDQFNAGAPEWSLSLVGYSIGKRPYYETLLSVIKKAWQLKGSISLLTMDEGFFLLKFTALEDYEYAWMGGPWFFFGKPFILQKWTPDFVPKREEFPAIPLWIKILNLPLSLWTPEGISKLASCIGIPIAVDALTAAKIRLTFARVCVQITSSSFLPEEIFYSVEGKSYPLRVQYDWKPEKCSQCGSIMHPPTLCPKDPILKTQNVEKPRGRSTSRRPKRTPPPKLYIPKPPLTQNITQSQPNHDIPPQPPTSNENQNPNAGTLIPNLNSPSGDIQDITDSIAQIKQPVTITTKNKFEALNGHDNIEETLASSFQQAKADFPSKNDPTNTTNPNLNSPSQTSPRLHQPNIPSSSMEPSTSSSTSSKAQPPPSQNPKQTRGKAKKASTPNPKSQ